MTEAEATQAILEAWEDGWDPLHPEDPDDPEHVPYTYDNEVFDTGSLGDLGAWARVSIRHSTGRQATMGSAPSRKFERRGFIMVQLFAPIDQGRTLLSELADDVRTALEGVRSSELLIHEGVTEESPSDGRWAMSVVTLPFRYTQTR